MGEAIELIKNLSIKKNPGLNTFTWGIYQAFKKQ